MMTLQKFEVMKLLYSTIGALSVQKADTEIRKAAFSSPVLRSSTNCMHVCFALTASAEFQPSKHALQMQRIVVIVPTLHSHDFFHFFHEKETPLSQ